MPSTALGLAARAGVTLGGVVPWGQPPPCDQPGVYLVCLDRDEDSTESALAECPISITAVEKLLSVRSELTVDGKRPSAHELAARIGAFWLPTETILYIGLAGTSLSERVKQYYQTPLGARSPHAGGWFLKTLTTGPPRWVHWARAEDPDRAEDLMLKTFCSGVRINERQALPDPDHPFPFANLEWPRGVRKRHGIAGAKQRRLPPNRPLVTPSAGPVSTEKGPEFVTSPPSGRQMTSSLRSQQVTPADRAAGQIRVPTASKSAFPRGAGPLRVVLRGTAIDAGWNPRIGPDRERSGTLRVGSAALSRLVPAGTILVVTQLPDGSVDLR